MLKIGHFKKESEDAQIHFFFWVVSNSDEFYFNLLFLWVTNFFISLNIILWTICFDAHSTCFHFTLKLLSTNFSCSEQYWNWRHQPPPFLVPIKSTNSLHIGFVFNLRYSQFQSYLCYFLFNYVWIILRSRLWNVKVFNSFLLQF